MTKKGKHIAKFSASDGILIIANNKKAFHDYEILQCYEAGISLKGSEVKSIREGNINLKDTYLKVLDHEVFLIGSHISPYSHSREEDHSTTRDRKLLLHMDEIEKLFSAIQQKGLTLVPLKVYFKNRRCKIEIGLGRGKKLYDKREDLKKKEANREIERGIRKKIAI
ncbi:MAG: SsrA-binding protein SmpB [Deltaproteobacteria bacterium]|jgi:SsrA-binding protein|nr:SsrA-binding protein SmpB [Deltaproteobacteria bacterium]